MGMSNGFWQGLQQGGTVTWLVALVLLVMSVLSWVVIAYKAMGVLQHRRMARQAVQWCHWSAEQRKAWREQTTDLDPYATLTDLGHEAVRELARLRRDQPHKKVDEADWISQKLQLGLDRNALNSQQHLTVLASVGATAPFVGLLGTVWGIYHALTQIGVSGQASIDQVAGPVGEALVMTALGLVVAIPAVLAYNAFVRAHRNLMAQWREFAHALQAHFVVQGDASIESEN